MAGYSTPKDNVHLLEDLLGTRREMAQLMGAPSYAHYTLKNATLAGCPEAVESFLLELLAAIKPKVTGRAAHLGQAGWVDLQTVARCMCITRFVQCRWKTRLTSCEDTKQSTLPDRLMAYNCMPGTGCSICTLPRYSRTCQASTGILVMRPNVTWQVCFRHAKVCHMPLAVITTAYIEVNTCWCDRKESAHWTMQRRQRISMSKAAYRVSRNS